MDKAPCPNHQTMRLNRLFLQSYRPQFKSFLKTNATS